MSTQYLGLSCLPYGSPLTRLLFPEVEGKSAIVVAQMLTERQRDQALEDLREIESEATKILLQTRDLIEIVEKTSELKRIPTFHDHVDLW